MSDAELLQRYARDGSSSAFAELVTRHLDLVYSVARRHLGSTGLVEDVAQSVFLDLARQAARFDSATPLVAWLHTVARRKAIDAVRRESRRRSREQYAAELALFTSPTMPTPSSAWPAIEPLLDEVVESLPPADRSAILFRFFENKSLRDVGTALGISDDAAQKRLSRALDRLRTALARRGITTTAATLAADLSAAALHPAPAALAGTISAAATTLSTTAFATSTTVAMTTLQKTLAVSALVLTAGTAAFQAHALHEQRGPFAHLTAQIHALSAELSRTRASATSVAARLAETEEQIDRRLAQTRSALPPPLVEAELEKQIRIWLETATRLKSFLESRPDLAIPELRLLTEQDWAEIATRAGTDAVTPDRLAAAAAHARNKAQSLFAPRLHAALKAYLVSSGNVLPDSLAQLLPHFTPPVAPDLLSRYVLVQRGNLDDLPTYDRNNHVLAVRTVVDPERDETIKMGFMGWATYRNSAGAFTPHPRKP